jgi:hypothetical protein
MLAFLTRDNLAEIIVGLGPYGVDEFNLLKTQQCIMAIFIAG